MKVDKYVFDLDLKWDNHIECIINESKCLFNIFSVGLHTDLYKYILSLFCKYTK